MTRYRLDSQFHCSYLKSRGVPGKTREIRVKKKKKCAGNTGKKGENYLPFISGSRLPVPVTSFPVMPFPVTSGGATSGDVISGVHTAPPQIGLELCPYTTFLKPSELQGGFVPLDSLLGLCPGPAGDLKRSADIFIGYSSGTIHLPGYLQSNKSLDGIYYLN